MRPGLRSAALALAAVLAGCGGSSAHSTTPATARPAVQATVAAGPKPCAPAEAPGAVWVTDYGSNMLARIDPATNRVVKTYRTGGTPCGIAYAGGALWVANVNDLTLGRLDPATGRSTRTIDVGDEVWDVQAGNGAVGGTLSGLAVVPGGVWVADQAGNRALRIDPATNRVSATVETRPGPVWFAASGRELWVADGAGNTVQRIDPASSRITATVPLAGGPLDPGLAGGSLWVPTASGRMWRVPLANPEGRSQSRWPAGIFVAQPAAGSLWLLDYGGTRAWRINPLGAGLGGA